MQQFFQQQSQNYYRQPSNTLNFNQVLEAFKNYSNLSELKKDLLNLGVPLYLVQNALANARQYILHSDPDLNAILQAPFHLQSYNPLFKDYLGEMLIISLFAIKSNNIQLNTSEYEVLRKVFDYVFKDITTEINDRVISEFKNIFNNLVAGPLSLPVSLEAPYPFSDLLKVLSPKKYEANFTSGYEENQRPKFSHFFPSFYFLIFCFDNLAGSTELMSQTTKQDWRVFVDSSKLKDFFLNRFGVDLTTFLTLPLDKEEKYAISESRWMNLLARNTSLLLEIVNNSNLSNEEKEKLISSINNKKLDENLTLFFNFFGAAAIPFLLGVLADYCFVYQVQNGIKDGVFQFSEESIKNWKNFLDVYVSLYKKNGKVDLDKIKSLLNNDLFVQNDIELLKIKQKIQQRVSLEEKDIDIITNRCRRFLPSFTVLSTASGEKFITTEEERVLESFMNYTSTNADKVLRLVGIETDQPTVKKAFEAIAPYSFFDYWVYYISSGVERDSTGNLKAVYSRYNLNDFLRDFISISSKDPSILPYFQSKKILYTYINNLSVLPSKETQKDYVIKIGYVDKEGVVHYGDGKTPIKKILEEGGMPIYFVESEKALDILNKTFFKDQKIAPYTEEVMKKLRTFSNFSVGQKVEKDTINVIGDNNLKIEREDYLVTFSLYSKDINIYVSPIKESIPQTTVFVTTTKNDKGSQNPQGTQVENINDPITSPYPLSIPPFSHSIDPSGNNIIISHYEKNSAVCFNISDRWSPPFSPNNFVYPSSKQPWGIPTYLPSESILQITISQPSPQATVNVLGGVVFSNRPTSHDVDIYINGVKLSEEQIKNLSVKYFLVGWGNDGYLKFYNPNTKNFESVYVLIDDNYSLLSIYNLDKITSKNPNARLSFELHVGEDKINIGKFYISKDNVGNYSVKPEINNSPNPNLAKFFSEEIPITPAGYNSSLYVHIDKESLNRLSNEEKQKLGLLPVVTLYYEGKNYPAFIDKVGSIFVLDKSGNIYNIGEYDLSNNKIKSINKDGLKAFVEQF